MNRRRFITGSIRFAAAGGLIGLSGFLLTREHPEGSKECDFEFICKNCRKKQQCVLPEAVDYRKKDQKL